MRWAWLMLLLLSIGALPATKALSEEIHPLDLAVAATASDLFSVIDGAAVASRGQRIERASAPTRAGTWLRYNMLHRGCCPGVHLPGSGVPLPHIAAAARHRQLSVLRC